MVLNENVGNVKKGLFEKPQIENGERSKWGLYRGRKRRGEKALEV